MKGIKAIYIIGAAVALAGCSDKELAGDATLSFTPKSLSAGVSSVSFGAKNDLTATLPVRAQNTQWSLTGEPAWLTVEPKQGSESADVKLTAQENTSADEARMGVLSLTGSDLNVNRTISVLQKQADVILVPSTTSLSVKAAASSVNVAVTANVEWTATCSDTWLSLECSGNTLNVTIAENLGASRSTTIHLKRTGTDATLATIEVAQGEAGVTGSTEQLTLDVNGEERTYTFEANASWTATTSAPAWLTVTPANGSHVDKQLKITAQPNYQANERSGFIYIKIGTTTKLEIPVKQNGVEMTMSETSLKFDADTEIKTVTVTSNVPWQIINKPEWITVSPSNGETGSTNIDIKAEANNDNSPRDGRVEFAIGGGTNGFLSIDVSQNGAHITEVPNSLDILSYAQSFAIDVHATGFWMVTTDSGDWIQVSPTEHTGDGVLEIEIAENTSNSKRTGKVTIIQPGGAQENQVITINQAGKTFTMDCSDVISSAKPCTVTVSVASGVNWIVESEVDWLTPSPLQGTGNGEINVDVAFNPSVNSRNGNLKFTADGKGEALFAFSQPGRTLSVDAEQMSFSSKGGESQVITIAADGEFDVTTNRQWITVIRQSGANTFTISVPELAGEAARGGEVTIALTGVPSGEETLTRTVKVTQAMTSVGLGGFEEDEEWN